MTPEERAARAIACQNLLNDPNVKDALAHIRSEFTDEWRRSQTTQERENMWRAMNIMDRLEQWLRTAASHDKTALRRTGL
jgi:hypothetical protein